MIRKVEFPEPFQMIWDNAMEVNHGGHWVKHTAVTTFVSVTREAEPTDSKAVPIHEMRFD